MPTTSPAGFPTPTAAPVARTGAPPEAGAPARPPAPPSNHRARLRDAVHPLVTLVAIAVGAVAWAIPPLAARRESVWLVGLVLTGAPVVLRTVRGMLRGHFAADVVAALALVAAVALHEPLAGLIVVLMQTGGEALERLAEGRASAAVRALEEAAPRTAHRQLGDLVEDVAADDVAVGDLLLVRAGELVPCDGEVVAGRSHVDASRLTGEPVPVLAEAGSHLMSGSVNGEGSLTMRATAVAWESQYARIVELVRSAQESKSPLQRLADRYAVWFTPLTLVVCVAAYVVTRDPLRVLAVLVVATPCPLILATPVAIIGGINRAARRHIIVRHGTAMEQLASVRVAVFDKTGTVTVGHPEVLRVVPCDSTPAREALLLAAAVEQGSTHVLARATVAAAAREGLAVPTAENVTEWPGRGATGLVDGRAVMVGSLAFVRERHPGAAAALEWASAGGDGMRAYVAADGRAVACLVFADRLRPGFHDVLEALRELGIRRTLLLSGDNAANTRAVALETGIDEAMGDLLPQDKVDIVRAMVDRGERVVMIGDGINDAPALSSATVGVALAGHGGGITAEAANVVILVDDPGRVPEAVRVSRRTLRIARQSIWAGLGLSAVAMGFAAAGHVPPTIGALLQEAIDMAVIVNALRASRGAPLPTSTPAR